MARSRIDSAARPYAHLGRCQCPVTALRPPVAVAPSPADQSSRRVPDRGLTATPGARATTETEAGSARVARGATSSPNWAFAYEIIVVGRLPSDERKLAIP